MVTSHLIRLGFEVSTTGHVHQALARVAERRGSIALVLLDMTMFTMNGAEVFRAIRAVDPNARILLMSGYTTNPDVPFGCRRLLPADSGPRAQHAAAFVAHGPTQIVRHTGGRRIDRVPGLPSVIRFPQLSGSEPKGMGTGASHDPARLL
jgi:CheY-like chemotaxis protein